METISPSLSMLNILSIFKTLKKPVVLSLGDFFCLSLTFLDRSTLKLLQIRSSGCSSYEVFSPAFLEFVSILITFHFLSSGCASHTMLTVSPWPWHAFLWQREKLLRRHSAHALRPNGEEEEISHPPKKNRVTMDFSLLTIPALPEKILHTTFSLQLQEVSGFCAWYS